MRYRQQRKGWPIGLAIVGLLLVVPVFARAEDPEGAPLAPSIKLVERPGEKLLTVTGRVSEPEKITTGAGGIAHILLSDQTSLTIGPHSDVTLEEFAYSPGQIGTLELTLQRGLLRVVGGRLARQADIAIRTPLAVVTTRTGVALIDAGADDSGQPRLDVTLLHGDAVTITQADGLSRTIGRPGFQARVTADGISEAARINPDNILQRLQRLDNRRPSQSRP